MENASRAMVIAASTLLAVIIMALMFFAITQVGRLSTQTNINETTEQIAKFNQEYEAYNKKIMYYRHLLSILHQKQ